MSALRGRATALWAGFMARTARERWLLVAVGMLGVAALADALWLTPALRARQQARLQEATTRQALNQAQQSLQAQLQAGTQQRQQQQAERAALSTRLQQLQAQARLGSDDPAPRLQRLLEQLVAAQGGELQLMALKSLRDPSPASAASAAPRVHRHGLQLVVAGRYEALQRYLHALAALDEPLQLDGLRLDVVEHPRLELSLELSLLSPDPDWMRL